MLTIIQTGNLPNLFYRMGLILIVLKKYPLVLAFNLEELKYLPFKGKKDVQVVVRFKQCHLLTDKKVINASIEKIQSSDNGFETAKQEAKRLTVFGFDAYELIVIGRKAIVFLNYPEPLCWKPFDICAVARWAFGFSIVYSGGIKTSGS